MVTPHKPAGSQAVHRALSVLQLFDHQTEWLTIGEVADALGVHRSTASRLIAALEGHRLLELDPRTGAYTLGLGLVSLASSVLNRFPVRASAREVVRTVRDETGETVHLGVVAGDEVIYIDQATTVHAQVEIDWVGRRHRLTHGVTGALLLAYQPSAVIDELLAEARSEGRPEIGLIDEAVMADTRRRGYYARYHDPHTTQAAVAAPVLDHRGQLVAALCVGGPRHRIGEDRFEDELVPVAVQAAAKVSERLGFHMR
jgi:DNA-binding IclR family transcriptional regulator